MTVRYKKQQTVNCQENLKMRRMQWNLCSRCRHWRLGGYNPDEMSEETIVEFANEILQQLKLVSYKYKR